MTEILTESFCERCGTRYTFEPVVNRRKPLSAIGTLGRGIRHFVSDPGSSLDEAMAVARSETEQRSTASALEAFHRTFNFCLSCRQYTCSDCWNAVEGRCLSCAPTPDAAPPATRLDTTIPLHPMDLAPASAATRAHDHAEHAGGGEHVAESGAEAAAAAEWAAVSAAAAAAEAAETGAAAEAARADAAAAEAAMLAEAAARAEAEAATAAAAAQVIADAEAAADAQAEAAEAEAAARAAAEEAERAAAEERSRAVAEAEARAAAEAEAQAIEAARADAQAAAVAAMAEAEGRAAAEAEAQAAADATAQAAADQAGPALAFEPGLNLDDQIAAYERQRAAADRGAEPAAIAETVDSVEVEPEAVPAAYEPIPTAIGHPVPASAVDVPVSWPDTEVAAASFEPSWPDSAAPQRAAPQSAAPGRGAGLPAAEQPVMPLAARACPSCGLSLSASARFCRRCGTPQVVA